MRYEHAGELNVHLDHNDELSANPTPDLERGMLLSRVVLAAFRLREELARALQSIHSPLSPQTLEILRALALYGACTRAGLGRILGVRGQSLHRALSQLETAGLLRRVSHAGGRTAACLITDAGIATLDAAAKAAGAVEDRLFRGVDPTVRKFIVSTIGLGADTANLDERAVWHPLYQLNWR